MRRLTHTHTLGPYGERHQLVAWLVPVNIDLLQLANCKTQNEKSEMDERMDCWLAYLVGRGGNQMPWIHFRVDKEVGQNWLIRIDDHFVELFTIVSTLK